MSSAIKTTKKGKKMLKYRVANLGILPNDE